MAHLLIWIYWAINDRHLTQYVDNENLAHKLEVSLAIKQILNFHHPFSVLALCSQNGFSVCLSERSIVLTPF